MPEELRTRKKTFALTILAVLLGLNAAAQGPKGVYDDKTAHNLVWEGKLERRVEFWCDSVMAGRGAGTRGMAEASFSMVGTFRDLKLLPLSGSYVRSFPAKDSTVVGHNVVGMIPGSLKFPVESYIIVGAHLDNLGILDGKMYPGADSNASGIVALTSLAEMFSTMKVLGRAYASSIIFVAFDCNSLSMAGAYALWDDIEKGRLKDPVTGRHITSDKVKLMVNIDKVGTSLSPLQSGREDFLIMLGVYSLPLDCRNLLSICNRLYDINMELSHTYYRSESFTNLFYTLSDQRPFVEHGMPAVLFTSGITMNTNKTYDLPSTLNYPVLRRRIYLIYHWLDRLLTAYKL